MLTTRMHPQGRWRPVEKLELAFRNDLIQNNVKIFDFGDKFWLSGGGSHFLKTVPLN